MFLSIVLSLYIGLQIVWASPQDDIFIYHGVLPENVSQAQLKGSAAFDQFIEASSNSTDEERKYLHDAYLSKCNELGKEKERLVALAILHNNHTEYFKLLLATGLSQFLSKFLTLPKEDFETGIRQLCSKYELQLQCQLGFNQTRAQIETRVKKMKRENGSLKILLEEECAKSRLNYRPYHCIRTMPEVWTAPCAKEMLQYNYTRFSTAKRIARIHISTTNEAAGVAEFNSTTTQEELDNIKTKIDGIMRDGLIRITEIEAEKCDALGKVLSCTLPAIQNKCGKYTESMMRTMIAVGYLPRERREVLQNHFEEFDVSPHEKCKAVDPSI